MIPPIFPRALLSIATGALLLTGTPAIGYGQPAEPIPVVPDSVPPSAPRSPPFLNMRAWSVGTGASSGLLGVETVRRLNLQAAIAVGVGVGGVGARVVAMPFEAVGRVHTWIPYVSGETLYAPWRWSGRAAAGGIGYGVGLQRWGAEGAWFGDWGVGVLHSRDGVWFGRQTLPVLRLGLGRGSTR